MILKEDRISHVSFIPEVCIHIICCYIISLTSLLRMSLCQYIDITDNNISLNKLCTFHIYI